MFEDNIADYKKDSDMTDMVTECLKITNLMHSNGNYENFCYLQYVTD